MAQNVGAVTPIVQKCSDDYYVSRKSCYKFVEHPFHRRKLQYRLLRQLQQLLDEFTVCVGQQIVLIDYTRPLPQQRQQHNRKSKLRIYGAEPLQCIIDRLTPMIISKVDQSLIQQPANSNPSPSNRSNVDNLKFDLPLISDGSTTSLARMKQSQLRTFIPLMIKYSTGRRKVRWGRQASKPDWWPSDIPWENVRCDGRSQLQKAQTPWTTALRNIVSNCYKYHQREDLLVKPVEPDNPPQSNDNGSSLIQANSTTVAHNHHANANTGQPTHSAPSLQMQDNLQASKIKSNHRKRRNSDIQYQLGQLRARQPLAYKDSSRCYGNLLNGKIK